MNTDLMRLILVILNVIASYIIYLGSGKTWTPIVVFLLFMACYIQTIKENG